MQVGRTLTSGQKGTQKFLDQYGDQLVCVCYRYDEERQLRRKTVELIVESTPWIPRTELIPPDSIVGLKVGLNEVNLQKQIRQAGGKWNRQLRLWQIRYDQAVALKLEARIEPTTMPISRHPHCRSKTS